ncbi:sodium/proline symporter PutP [Lachnospiraceae bacterium C1.1]|nr:sodium/proline symporter PutP [Lachnospiraceae bacterium C1.1]
MNSVEIWEIAAFIFYLGIMIVIGAVYSRKNQKSEDYFLGGRSLGGLVAAFSAQASDMSGWLLMGLPGAIFLSGLSGDGWIAIGLLIGTALNWIVVASPLRRYTIEAGNSVTLPKFFENRYKDEKKILMIISSIIIALFFTVYTASAFASGGKLFNSVFHLDYHLALSIGAAVILLYTFLGGFMAVCTTDFIQGSLMIVALLTVPMVAISIMNGNGQTITEGLINNGIADTRSFTDFFTGTNAIHIISGMAWGLGYFGMPHILVRFMAVKNEKEMNKSKVIAISWVTLSLAFAVVIGIVGRAFMDNSLFKELNEGGSVTSEYIFIEMIKRVFTEEMHLAVIAGIFLCGFLAAIMSTADSQLLVSASAIAEDIYKGVINKNADDKSVLRLSRIAIVVIAVIAFIIAWNPDSSIMSLVSDAWAGLGAAFGPLVLMSLFWRRTNLQGAIAGLVSGAAVVIVWDYLPIIGGQTIYTATGLYSLVPGFFISLMAIVIVSLLNEAPSEDILNTFDKVHAKEELQAARGYK